MLALGVASSVSASIGPVATLNIVNSDIAPDGFLRSTVLAGGTFPGPLIVGDKVSTRQTSLVVEITDPLL